MYLVLILLDGSKSMVPAEWTDFALPTQPERAPAAPSAQTLGSLEDLLHARAVVDALLSRPRSLTKTFHDRVLSLCLRAAFTPRVVQEANEILPILHLVRAGVGVSLVPRSALRLKVPGVRFHELGWKEPLPADLSFSQSRTGRRRRPRGLASDG